MDGTSLTPEQEKINALRQVLPEAFTEGKARLGKTESHAWSKYKFLKRTVCAELGREK